MPSFHALLRFVHLCSCEDDCEYANTHGTKGRVCDYSCEDGDPYGTRGCSASDGKYGPYCRACFYDVDMALAYDSTYDRAIM